LSFIVFEMTAARKRKGHAQDCETLRAIAASASGDPAMAFEFEMAAILPMVRASRPSCPAAGLLLSVFTRASHAPRDRTV
jgi:hypothetical protein